MHVRVLMLSLAGVLLGGVLRAAEAEGGATKLPMNPFVPQIVWAIASFLVVLFVVWKKLMPAITGALDRRAQEIRDALSAAEKARAEAEAMIRSHEDALEKSRQEARSIIEEGKRDAERLKETIVQQARHESEEITQRAKREIELAKGAALHELHTRSVELSFDLASRLIQRSLDPNDHQDLVRERIRSLEVEGV